MLESRLLEVLKAFARTLSTNFSIQGILDQLVERIVDILPIDGAGVTLFTETAGPRFAAASNELSTQYEHLQLELNEGPCREAYESNRPVSIPDLTRDERFPRFAQKAVDRGLVAVFSLPLRSTDRPLGALDLYRKTAGGLDRHELAAAQTLADVATAYLLNAQSRNDLTAAAEVERQAADRLRTLDRAKSEFVATVSHELRTPMTSITGTPSCCTTRPPESSPRRRQSSCVQSGATAIGSPSWPTTF